MLPPTYYDPTVMNVPVTAAAAAAAAAASNTHAWKDGSFSFHDVLDALNPLQHIPVVSSIYRWLTGDEPGNVARIVGDGLYGGPIGLGAGLISVAFKEETGKDPGEMAMAALTGEEHADVQLGTPAPAPAAPAPVAAAATAAAAAPSAAPAPPAVAAGAPAPAIQPAAPSHPFLPLYATAPAAPAPAAGSSPAEQSFLMQNAAYQRSVYGMHAPALQHQTTAPIPLQLTGAQLPMVSPRPAAAPPVAPVPVPPGLPGTPAADIPQKMMDALDKYARMQQQQQQQQRGQQVDVAP